MKVSPGVWYAPAVKAISVLSGDQRTSPRVSILPQPRGLYAVLHGEPSMQLGHVLVVEAPLGPSRLREPLFVALDGGAIRLRTLLVGPGR